MQLSEILLWINKFMVKNLTNQDMGWLEHKHKGIFLPFPANSASFYFCSFLFLLLIRTQPEFSNLKSLTEVSLPLWNMLKLHLKLFYFKHQEHYEQHGFKIRENSCWKFQGFERESARRYLNMYFTPVKDETHLLRFSQNFFSCSSGSAKFRILKTTF